MKHRILVGLLLLAAPAFPQSDSTLFRSVAYNNKTYFVCEADPRAYNIEVFNKSTTGVHSFASLQALKKGELLFAVNGGMYEHDLSPVGLLVTGGKTLHPLNVSTDGNGNFYDLRPNGVFLITGDTLATVLTTDEYAATHPAAITATQSGPMLVTHNEINKHFNKTSANLNIRNGVGVNKEGRAVFVISETPVNFYEFAELFRDQLGCENALYLDGVVSQYIAPPAKKQMITNYPLAIFLTITRKAP